MPVVDRHEIPTMLSLAATAKALEMDERTVRRFIGSQGRDRLVAAKIGGRWKVRTTDLNGGTSHMSTNLLGRGRRF